VAPTIAAFDESVMDPAIAPLAVAWAYSTAGREEINGMANRPTASRILRQEYPRAAILRSHLVGN
jgi:hypothetical protein